MEKLAPGKTRLLVIISKEIKNQFKAYCARNDISMRETIEDLMRDRIHEDLGLEK